MATQKKSARVRSAAPPAKARAKAPRESRAQVARRRQAFLAALAATGNVSAAAAAAGVDRRTPYKWRGADAEFGQAWEDAIEQVADALEQALLRRAVDGVVVEHRDREGRLLWTETRYSDTAAIFLLKGLRPDKYAERRELRGRGTGGAITLELIDQVLAGDGVDGGGGGWG